MIGGGRFQSPTRRFVVFAVVGATNTGIDIVAFACLWRWGGLDVISSNVLAFLLAVTNSYFMNRLITFRDRRRKHDTIRGMGHFFLVATSAMAVSTAIVFVFSLFMHPLIGKLFATAASTAINYIGATRLVFSGDRSGGLRVPIDLNPRDRD